MLAIKLIIELRYTLVDKDTVTTILHTVTTKHHSVWYILLLQKLPGITIYIYIDEYIYIHIYIYNGKKILTCIIITVIAKTLTEPYTRVTTR